MPLTGNVKTRSQGTPSNNRAGRSDAVRPIHHDTQALAAHRRDCRLRQYLDIY